MSAFSSPPCPSSVISVLCTSCPGDTKTSALTNDVFPGRPNACSTVNARPFSEDVGKKEKAIFALIVPSYVPYGNCAVRSKHIVCLLDHYRQSLYLILEGIGIFLGK